MKNNILNLGLIIFLVTFIFTASANENCYLNSDNEQAYAKTFEYKELPFNIDVRILSSERLALDDIDHSDMPKSLYKSILVSYTRDVLEKWLFYSTTIVSEGKTKNGQWRIIKAEPFQGTGTDLFLIEVGKALDIFYMKNLLSVKLDEAEMLTAVSVISEVSNQVSKACGIEADFDEIY